MLISPLSAERPSAPQLLPKDTLAYFRVRDAQEMVDRFKETAIGRMAQDEQMSPLISQLYGSAAEAFGEVEDEVGLPLDDLLDLFQGEMVVALVDAGAGEPVLAALIDVGPRRDAAEKLIGSGEAALAREGAERSVEDYRGVELITHQPPGRQQPLVHFVKDETVAIFNNADVAKSTLDVWLAAADGAEEACVQDADQAEADQPFEPLAANPKFTAVMRRCGGAKDEPAGLTWFVDPIKLYRVSTRGNFSAQAGLALLPVLGLDGLQGVGGSLSFATEDFDMLAHLHITLEEPRTGVVEMLALEAGDVAPEPWVPADASSYTTINWNAGQTYGSLEELYDSLRGEGRLAADVKTRISDQIGVDFKEEVIDSLGGRFTYVTWLEPPARIGGEAAIIGVKLNEPGEFQATLDKLTEKYGDNLEKRSYAGTTYFTVKRPGLAEVPEEGAEGVTDRQRRRAERRRRQQETFRRMRPSPCFAVVGDYLIAADRHVVP